MAFWYVPYVPNSITLSVIGFGPKFLLSSAKNMQIKEVQLKRVCTD
jgi:hypothetical protein